MAPLVEAVVKIGILLVLGIPTLLLLLKILRGEFWPRRLLELYREGKQ